MLKSHLPEFIDFLLKRHLPYFYDFSTNLLKKNSRLKLSWGKIILRIDRIASNLSCIIDHFHLHSHYLFPRIQSTSNQWIIVLHFWYCTWAFLVFLTVTQSINKSLKISQNFMTQHNNNCICQNYRVREIFRIPKTLRQKKSALFTYF